MAIQQIEVAFQRWSCSLAGDLVLVLVRILTSKLKSFFRIRIKEKIKQDFTISHYLEKEGVYYLQLTSTRPYYSLIRIAFLSFDLLPAEKKSFLIRLEKKKVKFEQIQIIDRVRSVDAKKTSTCEKLYYQRELTNISMIMFKLDIVKVQKRIYILKKA